MKNIVNVRVNKDGSITLPKEMRNQMCILPGDSLKIEYSPQSMAERCFSVSEDNDEDLFDGEWYCVPMRLLEMVGLDTEDVHVLAGEEEILITNTPNVMSVVPHEFVLAMSEQAIDFEQLVDSVVEKVNKDVLKNKE